jgi:hypothetical protein
MTTITSSANGTYIDCGLTQGASLTITCGGPSCPSLNSFPNLNCATDPSSTTSTCTNGITCAGSSNFISQFMIIQNSDNTITSSQQLSIDGQGFAGTDNGNGDVSYSGNGEVNNPPPSQSISSVSPANPQTPVPVPNSPVPNPNTQSPVPNPNTQSPVPNPNTPVPNVNTPSPSPNSPTPNVNTPAPNPNTPLPNSPVTPIQSPVPGQPTTIVFVTTNSANQPFETSVIILPTTISPPANSPGSTETASSVAVSSGTRTTSSTAVGTIPIAASHSSFRRRPSRVFFVLAMILSLFVAQIQAHSPSIAMRGVGRSTKSLSVLLPLFWSILPSGVQAARITPCLNGAGYCAGQSRP